MEIFSLFFAFFSVVFGNFSVVFGKFSSFLANFSSFLAIFCRFWGIFCFNEMEFSGILKKNFCSGKLFKKFHLKIFGFGEKK